MSHHADPVDRLVGGLFGLGLGCLRRLPAVVAFAIADALAVLLVVASWAREKLVGRGLNRNLRIVYREAFTPRMAVRMRCAWARHMTWLVVDFAKLPTIRKSNLDELVDTTEFQKLCQGRDTSKGLICVTGHIGVPELLGHVAALWGMTVNSLFRPRRNRYVDERITRIRASAGQKLLSKWTSLWPLKKALDRGEVLGLVVDEYTRHKPVFVPFLGTLAATHAAAAHLHLRTGAPMVVVSAHRVARLRYRLHVWDTIHHPGPGWDRNPEAAVESVLLQMNQALSRAILAYPEQWFWSGRRFRNRPPGEVLDSDGLPPRADLRQSFQRPSWSRRSARTWARS